MTRRWLASMRARHSVSRTSTTIKALEIVVFSWLFFAFLKAFCFEVYNIPSGSMLGTLWPGDKIVIDKLTYGPLLNINSFLVLFETESSGGYRLPGLSSVKSNDVIVFYKEKDRKNQYVKRCVGLPGERIWIRKSVLYIDDVAKKEDSREIFYEFVVRFKRNHHERPSNLMISDRTSFADINQREYFLTRQQADSLSSKDYVDTVYSRPNMWKGRDGLFLQSMRKSWDKNNYGPLTIPKKNQVIFLNQVTYEVYSNAIRNEGNRIELIGNKVFLNGRYGRSYKFKQNYYFVLGDSRDRSLDSRYIGFIPACNIIGKARLVMFSIDPENENVRWQRLFKVIK